jgi:hypothetical protein
MSQCSWQWWRVERWASARWSGLSSWFTYGELEQAALPPTPDIPEAAESPPSPWPSNVRRPDGGERTVANARMLRGVGHEDGA